MRERLQRLRASERAGTAGDLDVNLLDFSREKGL